MKTFLKYSTALAIVATSIGSVADAKMPMNFKPSTSAIQIKAPIVKVTPRIVDVPMNPDSGVDLDSLDMSGILQTLPGRPPENDGPRSEGTRSAKQTTRHAPKSAPQPIARPYNEFEERVPDGLRHLIDVTGGKMGDVRGAVTFLNEGPIDKSAAPEHWRDGGENLPAGVGGDRSFGANRVGVWDSLGGGDSAFGPEGRNDEYGVDMMAGIPRSPASQAPRDGKSSSDGWTHRSGRHSDGSSYRDSSRTNAQGGEDYRTETTYADGSMLISEISTSTDSKGVETVTSQAAYHISAPDDKGNRTVSVDKLDGSNGPIEQSAEDALVTGFDQDGDGQPDGHVSEEIADPVPAGGQDSQPNPEDNGAAEGLCSGWNPLTGCGAPGVKIQDATSQPNPTDDGSSDTRNAGASIGPEAVTNSGDGSFEPGGNTGGGGFKLDPCATVSGCGGPDGGTRPGPTNPGA